MNIRSDDKLRQQLAAAYALGTLRGGARRRFEYWLHQDAALRQITEQWQDKLGRMAEFATAERPHKRVWNNIEKRLRLQRPPAPWQFWLNENLVFWRNLGMASTGLAAALLLVVVMTLKNLANTPAINYVATLTDERNATALVVTADQRHNVLAVRLVNNAQIAADKSLQLWAVPKSGPPRSLGVLTDAQDSFSLADNALSADVAILAISLEPKGGSPAPTGPILYKGAWVRI